MSKKQPKSTELSICLAEFIRVLNDSIKDRRFSFDEVHRLDLLQNDYLHILELEDLDYKQRASIAIKIRNCRRERRRNKDVTELLEPITELMESKIGIEFMRQLSEVLGKTRKLEERNKSRIYWPRVLIKAPIVGGDDT